MAPPRQRPPTNVLDDSRSEASSGAREAKASGLGKSRKITTTNPATAAIVSSRDMNVAAVPSLSGATGVVDVGHDSDFPGIPWTQMPLSILHDYRHAYKLATPSGYARPYSQMLLSSGVGLRSPTAIAARRARVRHENRPDDASSDPDRNGEYHPQRRQQQQQRHGHDKVLHGIIGQGRVSKEALALAVRKHFNGVGLAEQDAIARFLYKVREEGKGKEFRLRFQPQS